MDDLTAIDISRGLGIVGRNSKLYTRLLGSFTTNTLYNELVQAVENNDSATAVERAHALKGVAANLALAEITSVIVPMETALKTGGITVPSEEDMSRLAEAYDKTVAAAKYILAQPEVVEKYK